MNEKTTKVFNGWLRLTDDERRAFDQAVASFKSDTSSGKLRVQESVSKSAGTRMELGPLDKGCPCCGR